MTIVTFGMCDMGPSRLVTPTRFLLHVQVGHRRSRCPRSLIDLDVSVS